MKKKQGPETDFAELRRQAEKRLLIGSADLARMPHEDINRLIHELQVHQIELEIQNEELRSAQLELEAERNKYTDLYDFAPVGYFTISAKGIILEANLTAAAMLGVDRVRLIQDRFSKFIDRNDQDIFYMHLKRLAKTKAAETCELLLIKKDKSPFYASLESLAVVDAAKNSRSFRVTIVDISERKQAAKAIIESEKKYRLLFKEMISGFTLREIIFDRSGKPVDARILDVNPTYERLTGLKKEQIIGKTVLEILPETESYWFESWGAVAVTGIPVQFENYHRQLDKHFYVSAFRLKKNQVAVHFLDITDRKNAEIKLQKAHEVLEERVEERTAELATINEQLKQEIDDRKHAEKKLDTERQRLFSVLDEMPAFIYLEAPDHSVRFANRYFRKRFGDFEGKKCYELLKGLKEPCKQCPTLIVFETGKPQEWEGCAFRDGSIYQIYDYPFTDIDGSQLVMELGIDITKRKQAESEMRRLSYRLLNAQEDVRKNIAFELHNELGQDLSVLKLHIDSIKRKLPKDAEGSLSAFDEITEEITNTIEKVRRISRDLSPSILVDLGLNAAFRWMLNSFSNNYDIKVSKDIIDLKKLLSSQQEIAIYRIFQEILSNIAKHAHASQISIRIAKDTYQVFFRVEDNGIGFDIDEFKSRYAPEKGLGLAAMEERVKMLNGHFEIVSRTSAGTTIAFAIPIDNLPLQETLR